MEVDAQTVVLVLVAVVVAYLVFRIAKYGGFKAAMFGAPMDSTVGTVRVRSEAMKTPITVHILGVTDGRKVIGLEVVASSFGSYQMLPVSLSIAEAKHLIATLEAAVDCVQPNGKLREE